MFESRKVRHVIVTPSRITEVVISPARPDDKTTSTGSTSSFFQRVKLAAVDVTNKIASAVEQPDRKGKIETLCAMLLQYWIWRKSH